MTNERFGSRFYEDTGRVITVHPGEFEEELTQNEVLELLNNYDKEIKSLSEDNYDLIVTEMELRADNKRLIIDAKRFKKQNDELIEENKQLKKDYNNAFNQSNCITVQKSIINDLKKENKQLKSINQDHQDYINDLEADYTRLEKKYNELKNKLNNLKQSKEEKE